jgi:uncharacterized repeat protein (TIGR03803 family)
MERTVNVLKLDWAKRACAVLALCAAKAIALPAQTLTTLVTFDGTNGGEPQAGLAQATNGYLYGTTSSAGTRTSGAGTIFTITPGGALTTLHTFSGTDGEEPLAGLAQATNGYLYGTTYAGGANGNGAVFKITPGGTLTTLYSFCSQINCTDGALPAAGLVQAANRDFYGATAAGGANGFNYGTVFKITPGGMLTTLYSFCSQTNCTDGLSPSSALVQAANGDLYGTTSLGGANHSGTVFKITPGGALTTLYSFCSQTNCTDGALPQAALVQAADGDLYGTTSGTIFKITPSGTLTTLYSFCPGCDTYSSSSGLVQASDGNLYGTNWTGVNNKGDGTIFKITPGGTLTTLYTFGSPYTEGSDPNGMVQHTNGDFYGTMRLGGAQDSGTVFRLSVGLGPFVEGRPPSGQVGTAIEILGTDLTGATSVSFDGTAATFTVVSRYLITTTVPAGASTGTIQVVTPSGTLSSNGAFRVLP